MMMKNASLTCVVSGDITSSSFVAIVYLSSSAFLQSIRKAHDAC